MRKIISIMMCVMFVISCGTITRKECLKQTVEITNISTGDPVDNAIVKINSKMIG